MRAYQIAPSRSMAAAVQPGSGLTARLDEALAAKLVEVLRTRLHHFVARRQGASHAVDLFLAHSVAAQGHADAIAARMVELDAEPGFSPMLLARNAGAFAPLVRPRDMAEEDLEAAHATDALLRALVVYAGKDDPATCRILLAIIEDDRIRVKDLSALVAPAKAAQ